MGQTTTKQTISDSGAATGADRGDQQATTTQMVTLVTVAVDQMEAEKLVHGIQTGTLYFALRSASSRSCPGTGVCGPRIVRGGGVTLLIEPDQNQAETYSFAIGHDTHVVDAIAAAHRFLDDRPDEVLVVVGAESDLGQALELARALHVERPQVGLVLMRRRVDVTVLNQALRAGVREVVSPPKTSAHSATRAAARSRCHAG